MSVSLPRRRFLGRSSAALAGFILGPRARLEAAPTFDIVLRGGTVLDGTGGPGLRADVGVVGDAIAALGEISAEQGRRVIDAAGLHVSPGFIDIHTHSDPDVLAYPTADSRVRQGVTTELAGNCGSSAAPLAGEGVEERKEDWRREGVEADWTDVASYLGQLERTGLSLNQALLVGQGTLRDNAVGSVDRLLSADEMAAVSRALEEGLDQGAFGLSTGLEYVPGRYTPTAEIVALTRIVARRGGLYATHIRNEESQVLEAVAEAIEIGRSAGARVQISHLKAAGEVNWPKQRAALDLIEAGRGGGVEVLADAYPYTAYSTDLLILMPGWAREGATAAVLARLRDPAGRARIRREVEASVAEDPGGWDRIVITSVKTSANQALVGRNMTEIAEGWSVDPAEAYTRLMEEESTSVGFVGHAMSPANVDRVLAHPLVMIGSDGSSMAPTGRAAETRPHPRSYGAFARVLGVYARERGLLDLPTAVRKMTSMPADQIGLTDRGRIAPGKKADLVVFDAATVADTATFENPHRYPVGIAHVLVNGVSVVQDGAHTGARPGRALRKS
ncbi:MAG: D-aminoacylase [Acidobacteria bacterium]|jgi:N-acyl-D-amino-acid deacylase|nr:D-aminoacylase [Acidobacteriota bacterium]